MRIHPAVHIWLAPISLGLFALLAYWPGLHGGFLFDDYGSLPLLGASGPITYWATFWRYITSGTADPTGRPLAMLTFLLDAHNWPADPLPFKRTNLILHLCNGALLYALLKKLGSLFANDVRRTRLAALLGCALWLLHPLLVSTTLYIVQREAMLAATCVMTGLLLWLRGRQRLLDGKLMVGATWSVLGLGGFTLLAALSKANGALLPIYVLLLETIVLAPRQPIPAGATQRAHRILMIAFGIIPAIAVFGYVTWTAVQGLWMGGSVGVRPWSIGQRLLTEPRVLMDYLKLLWLPRPFSSGLFNDQLHASTSWLHPATTLPSMIAILALVAGAWWQRRRHPVLALAVLFYFGGQLLESTSIPLELYFEHRNYAPALLMFWPLGLWLADTRQLRRLKIALMLALPLTLAVMTHVRTVVWGNLQTQGMLWARLNPASPRAQANAAEIEIYQGHAQAAAGQLERLLAAQPDQAQLAFNLINARCMSGAIPPVDLQIARIAMLRTANTGTLFVRWFEQALPLASTSRCQGLTLTAMLGLIDAGMKNPHLTAAGPQQDMTYLRGLVALAQNDPDTALADFVSALDLLPQPTTALREAAVLGQYGYPAQGLRLLSHYQQLPRQAKPLSLNMSSLHDWVLRRQNYWSQELATLKNELMFAARPTSMNTLRPPPPPITTH